MYDIEVFNEVIVIIIRGLIIPLIPVVTAFIAALIKKLIKDIDNQITDVEIVKHMDTAENIIDTAVVAVYQTYIDNILKSRLVLTDNEMKIAFHMIKEKFIKIISDTSMSELGKKYSDLDIWLESKIVCCANLDKAGIPGTEVKL